MINANSRFLSFIWLQSPNHSGVRNMVCDIFNPFNTLFTFIFLNLISDDQLVAHPETPLDVNTVINTVSTYIHF